MCKTLRCYFYSERKKPYVYQNGDKALFVHTNTLNHSERGRIRRFYFFFILVETFEQQQKYQNHLIIINHFVEKKEKKNPVKES